MVSIKGLLLCSTGHTLAGQKHQVVNAEHFCLRAKRQYYAQLWCDHTKKVTFWSVCPAK